MYKLLKLSERNRWRRLMSIPTCLQTAAAKRRVSMTATGQPKAAGSLSLQDRAEVAAEAHNHVEDSILNQCMFLSNHYTQHSGGSTPRILSMLTLLSQVLPKTSIQFRVDVLQSHSAVLRLLSYFHQGLPTMSPMMLCRTLQFVLAIGGKDSADLVSRCLSRLLLIATSIPSPLLFPLLSLIAQHPVHSQNQQLWITMLAHFIGSVSFSEWALEQLLHCLHLSQCRTVTVVAMVRLLLRGQLPSFTLASPASLVSVLFYIDKLNVLDPSLVNEMGLQLFHCFPFVTPSSRRQLLLVLASLSKQFRDGAFPNNPVFSMYPRKLTFLLSRWVEDDEFAVRTLEELYPSLVALTALLATNKFMAKKLAKKCSPFALQALSSPLFVGYIRIFNGMGMSKYSEVQEAVKKSLKAYLSTCSPQEIAKNMEELLPWNSKGMRSLFIMAYKRIVRVVQLQLSRGTEAMLTPTLDTLTLSEIVCCIRCYSALKLHSIDTQPLLQLISSICEGHPPSCHSLAYRADPLDANKNADASLADPISETRSDAPPVTAESSIKPSSLLPLLSMPELTDVLHTFAICNVANAFPLTEAIYLRYASNGHRISLRNLQRVLTSMAHLQAFDGRLLKLLVHTFPRSTVPSLNALQATNMLWALSVLKYTEALDIFGEPLMALCIEKYSEFSLYPDVKAVLLEALIALQVYELPLLWTILEMCQSAVMLPQVIPPIVGANEALDSSVLLNPSLIPDPSFHAGIASLDNSVDNEAVLKMMKQDRAPPSVSILQDLHNTWKTSKMAIQKMSKTNYCIGEILEKLPVADIIRHFPHSQVEAEHGGFIPLWKIDDQYYIDWANPYSRIGVVIVRDSEAITMKEKPLDPAVHLIASAALRVKYLENVKHWKLIVVKQSTVTFWNTLINSKDFFCSRYFENILNDSFDFCAYDKSSDKFNYLYQYLRLVFNKLKQIHIRIDDEKQ